LNTEYQTQSNKFIGHNHFKCKLVDQNTFDARNEWTFPVDPIHVKCLNGLQTQNDLYGNYGKYRDDPIGTLPDSKHLELCFKFSDNGITFDVTYMINLLTGIVRFFLSYPFIVKEEFKPHNDLPIALLKDIKAAPVDEGIVKMDDQLFDRFMDYVSGKYMNQFINYIQYLELLTPNNQGDRFDEPVCANCIFKRQYVLKGSCYELVHNK